MLQALLVTFREGLESLLIVGVIAAYLRKTGRPALVRGVRAGLVISIVTCLAGAYLWQMVPNQPLYEGIAAVTAAALVGGMLAQMLRMGRRLKGEIEARVDRFSGDAGDKPSLARVAGVALVTTLLVTREGLEAILYLGIQTRMTGNGVGSIVGAAVGLVVAAGVAWVWSHYAHRLNLGVVLKVTAVFLGAVSVSAGHLRCPRAGGKRGHRGEPRSARRDRDRRARWFRRPPDFVFPACGARVVSDSQPSRSTPTTSGPGPMTRARQSADS